MRPKRVAAGKRVAKGNRAKRVVKMSKERGLRDRSKDDGRQRVEKRHYDNLKHQLQEALKERDAAVSARNEAVAAQGEADQARDLAVEARDAAVDKLRVADDGGWQQHHDHLGNQLQEAFKERDAAVSARNEAVAAQDAADQARDFAVKARDAAIERLRRVEQRLRVVEDGGWERKWRLYYEGEAHELRDFKNVLLARIRELEARVQGQNQENASGSVLEQFEV